MCTCGIDIATQHATPATHSSTCAWSGVSPNGLPDGAVAPDFVALNEASGGRRRMNSASAVMVTNQKIPNPK